jgi:hypothetical protein
MRSVVGFAENGERLVGRLARRQLILAPKKTIYSAKRFIGRRFDEVPEWPSNLACMTEGPPGSRWWSRTVTSGEGPGGDGFRVSFGLVKEIVAGVRLSSRPG